MFDKLRVYMKRWFDDPPHDALSDACKAKEI